MSETVTTPQSKQQNAAPLLPRIIRSETVLARYPVHWLEKVQNAKKYEVTGIEVVEKDAQGTAYTAWKVTYNTGYGVAGILAYKLDTLVVSRRIDEARPEIPALIRLGSLREIAEEVGIGGAHTSHVKKALYQNAFAAIVTRQAYIGSDGSQHTFEFGDTRYGVFFLGQELPDGKKADAVYIALHDSYRALLNAARTRPLDYNYLKALAPGAQRFYELVSFQMFAALKHKRPRAKLLYSDYCSHAPQTRYDQFKRMHRQMKDIQEPHRASRYLDDVEYRATTDDAGNPDWEIFYTPGELAKQHYEAATTRKDVLTPLGTHKPVNALPAPAPAAPPLETVLPTPAPAVVLALEAALPDLPPHNDALVAELTQHGITPQVARKLAREKPEQCRKQLDLLPFQTITRSKAGFLRRAIEAPDGYGVPAQYEQQQKEQVKTRHQKATQERQEARRATVMEQLVQMAETLIIDHAAGLTDFLVFFRAERDRDLRKFPKDGRIYQSMTELYEGEQKQLELIVAFYADQPCPLPELTEFIRTHKPDRLKILVRAHFEAQSKGGEPRSS